MAILTGFGKGMGATTLTPAQMMQTLLSVGFPPAVATQMTAVGIKESSGNPNAVAIVTPTDPRVTSGQQLPEQSYGLFQINIQPGTGNPQIMTQLGLTDPSQLLDPTTNAKAAYLLYNNNSANLQTAWQINTSPTYQAALPTAEAAAVSVLGSDPLGDGTQGVTTGPTLAQAGLTTDANGNLVAATDPTTTGTSDANLFSLDLTDPTTLAILAIGAAVAAYYL